jgi:hypothetical protein
MPFPRPIDSTLHGVTDYTLGALLLSVLPRVAGVEGTESATQMRIAGAAHAAYSTVTDYPLGVVTGQYRKGPRHFVPHLALAAFELQSLLLSDPRGKGDFHGDVEAVRAANELNPHSRIYNGGPAVAAARG